jgi:hypothetical protein
VEGKEPRVLPGQPRSDGERDAVGAQRGSKQESLNGSDPGHGPDRSTAHERPVGARGPICSDGVVPGAVSWSPQDWEQTRDQDWKQDRRRMSARSRRPGLAATWRRSSRREARHQPDPSLPTTMERGVWLLALGQRELWRAARPGCS